MVVLPKEYVRGLFLKVRGLFPFAVYPIRLRTWIIFRSTWIIFLGTWIISFLQITQSGSVRGLFPKRPIPFGTYIIL